MTLRQGRALDAMGTLHGCRIDQVVGARESGSSLEANMFPAHVALVVLMSLLVVFSGVAKLRHDAHVVRIIHEVVRGADEMVPLARCL